MGDTITPNESDEYNSSTQYKKGGVLKGQDGLNSSQTFRPKFGSPG
jgi:hypothetical protein